MGLSGRVLYRTSACAAALLPDRLHCFLSRRAADIGWVFVPKARRILCSNLRLVFGESASAAVVRRAAREALRSFTESVGEYFGGRACGAPALVERMEYRGLEHLDAALRRGRGALLCSGHYSNWELGAAALALNDRPLTALIRRWSSPDINALFVRERTEWGVEVVHSGGGGDDAAEGASGARAVLRALRRNRAVALLADRAGVGPTATVSFFGRPALLPLGPWRLAERSGAPILPTFVHRRASRRYVLTVGAPLPPPPPAAPLDERLLFRARAWTTIWMERLRADPTQWAAFAPLRCAAESPTPRALQFRRPAEDGA